MQRKYGEYPIKDALRFFHLYHSTIDIINELWKKLLISNIWNIMAFLGLPLASVSRTCARVYPSAGAGAPADKHTPCTVLSKTTRAIATQTGAKRRLKSLKK